VQEANARQLVTRARARVSGERRVSCSPTQRGRLRDAFVTASRTGDLAILERLFASELPLRPSLSQVSPPVGHFGARVGTSHAYTRSELNHG
jgi:hypothetical protein